MSEGASVILNASINAQTGIPHLSTYSATKAAVRSLGRSLGAELAPRGIRVNVLSPGYIETPEVLARLIRDFAGAGGAEAAA